MYLAAILEALRRVKSGYFVWRDETGEEFVVLLKKEFDRLSSEEVSEVQLPLEPDYGLSISSEARADEVLERINRELAEYQAAADEDLLADAQETDDLSAADIPALRVRFEPLKGDLPPELQE